MYFLLNYLSLAICVLKTEQMQAKLKVSSSFSSLFENVIQLLGCYTYLYDLSFITFKRCFAKE